MALDANKELEQLRTLQDKIADTITRFAGTMNFVYIHSLWFGLWILAGLGVFGKGLTFDEFPFGLLTLIVSLEAIFLSTFVMISQNRQAKAAEIRSRLDYQTNVKAEKEIDIIMKTLQRLVEKDGIKIDDLLGELSSIRKQPIIKKH